MLSIVVVAYDMARELPRTLHSLGRGYQRDVDDEPHEVVLVDNGSPAPVDRTITAGFDGRLRTIRIDDAPSSPVRAANVGLEAAEGDLVGLMIDGARLASPGLLAAARAASRLAARPVIASLSWHLGRDEHKHAARSGHDQAVEDELLAGSGWERDGDRLFTISALAGSSRRGWFGPIGESNALFLPRALWRELGGLDERFDLPGGGLANHDLYARACALEDVQLIILLGEGTFHQIHGGAATSAPEGRDRLWQQYEAIRGHPYAPPANEPMYVGRMPAAAVPHLLDSARWAARNVASGSA